MTMCITVRHSNGKLGCVSIGNSHSCTNHSLAGSDLLSFSTLQQLPIHADHLIHSIVLYTMCIDIEFPEGKRFRASFESCI